MVWVCYLHPCSEVRKHSIHYILGMGTLNKSEGKFERQILDTAPRNSPMGLSRIHD